jgi:hypothetical protein
MFKAKNTAVITGSGFGLLHIATHDLFSTVLLPRASRKQCFLHSMDTAFQRVLLIAI